jgi:hypothetical protein
MSDEKLEPALREFYWLIEKGKISEDDFVKDMLHRISILKNQYRLSERQRIKEWVEKNKKESGNPPWKIGYNEGLDDLLNFLNK